MPLGREVDVGPGDIVLDGDPPPPKKKGHGRHIVLGGVPKRHIPIPIFGPCLLLPNGLVDRDATWYEDSPRPGDIVLDGNRALPTKRGTSAFHFAVHVYCGQTAGWIRIPLGTEVGLGPDDIVLCRSFICNDCMHGSGRRAIAVYQCL